MLPPIIPRLHRRCPRPRPPAAVPRPLLRGLASSSDVDHGHDAERVGRNVTRGAGPHATAAAAAATMAAASLSPTSAFAPFPSRSRQSSSWWRGNHRRRWHHHYRDDDGVPSSTALSLLFAGDYVPHVSTLLSSDVPSDVISRLTSSAAEISSAVEAALSSASSSTTPLDALAAALVDPLFYQHVLAGGLLALAGDVIAQTLLSKDDPENNGRTRTTMPPSDWDRPRTAAFVAFGALYTGGAQHFVFAFLNSGFDDPILRLGLAQFFFIPFCYYPTFLALVPALRATWEDGNRKIDDGSGGNNNDYDGGRRFSLLSMSWSPRARERRRELFSEVASKIPPTLVRNWCFWLPVQYAQFNFVPPDAQVTYAAAFGVLWNAILSWSTAHAASPVNRHIKKENEKEALTMEKEA